MMEYRLSIEEYDKWKDESLLVDIRDAGSYQYGYLPGAVNLPAENLLQMMENKGEKDGFCTTFADQLQATEEDLRTKKMVIYCQKGTSSYDVVLKLRKFGIQAYDLEKGYLGWLMAAMSKDTDDAKTQKERNEQIELSIRKKFHKQIFSKFAKAINEYQLLQPGDKVAVCISGGKDSMLMAKLFQELKRHNKFEFEVVFLVMDPGYNKENRSVIEKNAKMMNIPIKIFESEIFNAVYEIEKSPCYLCARMRRGYLYNEAKKLGCNKIALGHHYDDVIETILMGMLYGAQVQTMMPKLHSTNFEGMELIRPMYLIREDDIKKWRDYNDLHFIQCACRFTDTCTTCRQDGSSVSKRMEIKNLIRQLKEVNPFIESNIFRSVQNVNLSTIIAYKKDGVTHHFLDDYDLRKTGKTDAE